MKILVFDFETTDPFLGWKLGPGWAYEISNPTGRFKPLGCAIEMIVDKVTTGRGYVTDWKELEIYVEDADALVAHNALYDIGILKLLNIDYSNKLIYDTKIMAALFNNTDETHLDGLGFKYFKINKEYKELIACAKKHQTFKSDKEALKWTYSNMELLQETDFDVIANYALQDINITKQLLNKYLSAKSLERIDWTLYSDLIKGLVDSRAKGVRIDLKKAREISNQLKPKIAKLATDIFTLIGKEINLNSSPQVTKVCLERKLKVKKTDKGNYSATKGWMENQDDEFITLLSAYRRYNKSHKDFIQNFITMQEKILNKTSSEVKELDYGILHPELKPFGAKTGRFSSANPNIQQIPSGDRDKELGTLCRSIFVPWDGELWYAPDLSNQEGRLSVHYCALIKAPGIEKLLAKFKENPNYDMHKHIAALIYGVAAESIDKKDPRRTAAKQIGLGFLYGIGLEKLGKLLNLTKELAYDLKERYNKHCPCFQYLFSYAKSVLQSKGFITTISGRQLRLSKDALDDFYKALNMLIQGSAMDQIVEIIVWCYRNKLPILFTVHDEVNFSCKDKQKVLDLKQFMENGLKLKVPMTVDIHGGKNWAEAKYGT